MAISYRAAQTIIKRGDEPALRKALAEGLNANLTNENGWTLLMLAAVEGCVPVGRLLLESSANKAATNAKGDTAESIATKRGFAEFVALLNA
jgi:ankyrin repeat protein